ncbi:MAG: glycosyltransferase [Clostridiales bacterium GWD2_32_19]|nr:MAG: glycosyltransferase [Clostridiales bacterium GWD2_32_19]
MRSSAHKIKGHGVLTAYNEQVNLVKNGLKNKYIVYENKLKKTDIVHYHTIDLEYYLETFMNDYKTINVGYVHFLPETVDDSLNLPEFCKKAFYEYIIKFYKRMDHIVTVNPYFIDEIEKYGIDKRKVTYIPNYVSKEKIYRYEDSKRKEIRKFYNINENEFVVLCVGQVQTRKGVKDFVEVAKMLPNIKFIWVGGFSFGRITEGYEELKKIVANPPSNVNFMGMVERDLMNNIFNLADVMFLPSYNELFPMTILESMNCSVPLLLRDIPLYKSILFDYYNKGNNNNEFADILEHLRDDKEDYKKWAGKANEGSVFYSKENVLKLWENFYDGILKVDVAKKKGKNRFNSYVRMRLRKYEKKVV